MGTRAEGNFDGDGAMDFLGGQINQLVQRVEEILKDDGRVRLDEEGEDVLVPSVELIALLCERYDAAPPKEKTVAKWRKKYLKVYDKQIDGLAPQRDFKAQRRKVIEHTFDWLEGLSRSFYTK